MDCPNCAAKVKQEAPDRITCPTCGPLVRNADGEWEPSAALPVPPADPPKPPEPPLPIVKQETPESEDGPFFGVGVKLLEPE